MTDEDPPNDVPPSSTLWAAQTAISRLALADTELGTLLSQVCEVLAGSLRCRRVGFFDEADGVLELRAGVGWGDEPVSLPFEAPEPSPDAVSLGMDDGTRVQVVGFVAPDGRRGAIVAGASDETGAGDLLGLAAELTTAGWARRHLDAELRASESRLVEAQELAHMGSYDWNILTDSNVWSDELFRIYGYEPQSFNASYEKFLSLIHPDDRETIQAVHQEAYRTLEPYSMHERIVWPDGSVRTLASTGEVIADDQGRPVRMRGICIDVTDRLRVEAELARHNRAEERRRQASEINDNVLQGLTTILWSLGVGLHREAEEATRRTLESARAMMSELLDVGETISPGELTRETAPEAFIDRTDGRDQPQPTPTADRAPTSMVLADDAADLRLLLRFQLEQLDAVAIVGEAASGPEAVDQVAEHQPDVILLDMAMPGGDGLSAIPEIRRASPRTTIIALSGFSATDLARPALDAGAHAYVEKGDFDRVVEALRAAVPTLAEPAPAPSIDELDIDRDAVDDAPIEVAFGHLVHELKTPATVIAGITRMLADSRDALPSATVGELQDTLQRNVDVLLGLLDRVSTTIGASADELESEDVDLVALVRETATDLARTLERTVTVEADAEVIVGLDRLRITQVLVNLLTNACRYAPPDEPITVRVERRGGTVEVVVIDRGVGVDPKVETELFEPFVRDTRGTGGVGLGLYASRRIARAHGGDLRNDDVEEGASFRLVLPGSSVETRRS